MEGFDPQSFPGTYGGAIGQEAGVQTPLFYDMMESIPAVHATVMWNMGRVQRTLFKNKTAGPLNSTAGGIRQTISPFRFTSLADVGNIDPGFIPRGSTETMLPRRRSMRGPIRGRPLSSAPVSSISMPVSAPFIPASKAPGVRPTSTRRLLRPSVPAPATYGSVPGWTKLAGTQNPYLRTSLKPPLAPPKVANWAAPKMGQWAPPTGAFAAPTGSRYRSGRRGYTPFNVLADAGNAIYGKFGGGKELLPGQRAFAPGALGTMTAGSTLMAGGASAGKMTNAATAATRFFGEGANAAGFMQTATTGNLYAFGGHTVNKGAFITGGLEGARFGDAKFTGKAAGYFRGAQAARLGVVDDVRSGIQFAGKTGSFYDTGVGRGAEAFAKRAMPARLAGSAAASGALRAAPYVGWALLAKDLGKLGGTVVGRTVRLGIEATQSAQGDLNKRGPMGMGYQDNSVAATSRQRGVMAISSSRLNARSALGQEASYLYQSMR